MRYAPVIAFWALGILWGSNFFYMKLASAVLSPLQIVIFRVFFGFLAVAVYAAAKGYLKRAHLKYTLHFTVMAILATVFYFGWFAAGVALLPSGIAGALSGASPLFAFLIAAVFLPDERITLRKALGILAGFAGVILIADPFAADISEGNIIGALYIMIGSVSLGASFVYARKYVAGIQIPSAALTTYQLAASLVILTLITDFSGMGAIFDDKPVAALLVVGLGLMGTGVAYITYYYLVSTSGAVTAASATYVPPVVALFIGTVIAGEDIGLMDFLATGLIFTGVLLLRDKPKPKAI